MKPSVKEFYNEEALKDEVAKLTEEGYDKKDLFVIARDDARSQRVSNKADTKKVGSIEDSLGSVVVNLFKSKEEAFYQRFKQLGFNRGEADQLEKKLEEGKVLLLVGNDEDPRTP